MQGPLGPAATVELGRPAASAHTDVGAASPGRVACLRAHQAEAERAPVWTENAVDAAWGPALHLCHPPPSPPPPPPRGARQLSLAHWHAAPGRRADGWSRVLTQASSPALRAWSPLGREPRDVASAQTRVPLQPPLTRDGGFAAPSGTSVCSHGRPTSPNPPGAPGSASPWVTPEDSTPSCLSPQPTAGWSIVSSAPLPPGREPLPWRVGLARRRARWGLGQPDVLVPGLGGFVSAAGAVNVVAPEPKLGPESGLCCLYCPCGLGTLLKSWVLYCSQ